VIPFFERFGFLSAKKQRDFLKFVQLASLLQEGQHLTHEGVVEVLRIRLDMNDGGKRRYLDEEILIEVRESSETIRQTSSKGDDDMVRSAWRHAEHGRNARVADRYFKAAVVTTMNGPKVSTFVALVKFGYMLENPRILRYCLPNKEVVTIREVRTISRKGQLASLVELESSETTRRTAPRG
jgi:hypothetical protein